MQYTLIISDTTVNVNLKLTILHLVEKVGGNMWSYFLSMSTNSRVLLYHTSSYLQIIFTVMKEET